jgi:hypothetical protein
MKVKEPQQTHVYEVGGLYAFRTSPFTQFSPSETNRFAALKVLSITRRGIVYVVLDTIFDHMPTLEQLMRAKPLQCHRFFFEGRTALHCSPQDWENDLLEFRHIATVPLTAEELKLGEMNNAYGTWDVASKDAEGEWRWVHDREAVESEVQKANAERDAKIAADRLRAENHLNGLNWDILLEDIPFARWNKHPPFPPPEFVRNARERVRAAILELQALGPKPKKAPVQAILKTCVQWFNEQDKAYGYVIETEEREDICLALSELAAVAGHRSLTDKIDDWREW